MFIRHHLLNSVIIPLVPRTLRSDKDAIPRLYVASLGLGMAAATEHMVFVLMFDAAGQLVAIPFIVCLCDLILLRDGANSASLCFLFGETATCANEPIHRTYRSTGTLL